MKQTHKRLWDSSPPFPTEPVCLAELERIQVQEGGKRKFGMLLTCMDVLLPPARVPP